MKRKLRTTYKKFAKAVSKHSPEILTGIGIAGMFTAGVMGVMATLEALQLIELRKKEINDDILDTALPGETPPKVDRLEPIDLVKTTWKCYVPAVGTGVLSAACIIGASSVSAKRNAALATAYSISETTLKDYQKKVTDVIGEKKEQEVRDAVAKERLEREPVRNNEVIMTAKGETLCYDTVSGRYFKSDIDALKRAENDVNRRMRDECYISLNEFYYEIGLPSIKVGDDIGWNIDFGYLDLRFSSQLATDGTPCLVLDYGYGPKYDFDKLY